MNLKTVAVLGAVLAAGSALCSHAVASGGMFAGPGPGITGNSIGGIIPYVPADAATYQQIATDFCARYRRLGKVTSIDRRYGDYVSFVCYDRPGATH